MNPYEVLGVSRGATDAELHRAYVRLARRWHPDVNGGSAEAEERMRAVNEAWALLGDPTARARFDRRSAPVDPGFVPHDPVDDGVDPRTMPDVPYRPPSGIQTQWSAVSTAPVALFGAAVLAGAGGFWFDNGVLLGIGVVLFSLACVAVALVMLTALVGARRDEG